MLGSLAHSALNMLHTVTASAVVERHDGSTWTAIASAVVTAAQPDAFDRDEADGRGSRLITKRVVYPMTGPELVHNDRVRIGGEVFVVRNPELANGSRTFTAEQRQKTENRRPDRRGT
jgi:hypothetical protein